MYAVKLTKVDQHRPIPVMNGNGMLDGQFEGRRGEES